jgi:hypothetical protein
VDFGFSTGRAAGSGDGLSGSASAGVGRAAGGVGAVWGSTTGLLLGAGVVASALDGAGEEATPGSAAPCRARYAPAAAPVTHPTTNRTSAADLDSI